MVLMFEGDQKSGTHQFAIDLNDSTPCNWLDGQSQKGFILEAKNMKSELLEVFAQSKTVSIRVGEWRGASETTLWLIWID